MFQVLEHKFQVLEHKLQDLQHKFQDLQQKILGGRKTFVQGTKIFYYEGREKKFSGKSMDNCIFSYLCKGNQQKGSI